MKIPTITLKRTLEVTMKDAVKRINELDGLNEKALREEYKEWIEASENSNWIYRAIAVCPSHGRPRCVSVGIELASVFTRGN